MCPYPRSNWLGWGSFLDFCSDFHKIDVIRSSVCRTILMRRAPESSDPGASNGGSNFIFRQFGADMAVLKSLDGPESQISANREIRDSGPSSDFKTAM